MWDCDHPSVCHILLMTKPFSLTFTNFDTSVLDKQPSSNLDSCKNWRSNSRVRCEPKISILEKYFMLTLVENWYCPSLNLYTGPSVTPTTESNYGTPFSWFWLAPSPIQLPPSWYPWLFASLPGPSCLGTQRP